MSEVTNYSGNGEIDPITGEVSETETVSMAASLTKAEIDQQIATAHRFPRSPARVADGITMYATWSPGAASECNYALPRGGKSLTGPSIRLAEIIAAEYGNCRVGARVVHVDRFEKFIEAEAVFHDLEKNTATTARTRRRIVDAKGRLFSDDMIIVTGNAACSIAKRNAVLAGVPKALWMPAYEQALKVIKGDAKTLTERRDGALRALGAFGATPAMICEALEIGGPLEITTDHMPTLIAWHNALKDGTASVESLFPAPSGGKEAEKSGGSPKGSAAKMAALADEKPAAGETPAKTPEETPQADPGADAPGEGQGETTPQAAPADGAEETVAPAEPTDEEIAAAKARGAEGFALGMAPRAVPKDVKDGGPREAAWKAGWTEARDDAKARGE
ncbi:MAG: hypothetical protein LC676_11015 [Loktanella sp.]|nr:hypothetical protein [Loktanella sp.]